MASRNRVRGPNLDPPEPPEDDVPESDLDAPDDFQPSGHTLLIPEGGIIPSGSQWSIASGGGGSPGMAATIKSLIDAGRSDWLWTSVPLAERQGLKGVARMMRLRRGKSTSVEGVLGDVIAIKHVLIHPATKVDAATGEINHFPRLLLIGERDEVWDCASLSLIAQVEELILNGYPPPWSPALRVRITSKPATPPRRMYLLEIVE